MSDKVFVDYSRYYDLLYQDKDYIGESKYIVNLLKRHGIVKGSLLEFGSGTGKHGRLIANEGFQVHGIERSAEMVKLAEQINGFTCEVGDICDIQLNKNYDAVLSLFHVVSYQTTNADLHRVFSRAAEHLKAGGIFVFDVWFTPAVLTNLPSVRIKRMSDDEIEIVRIAEPIIYHEKNCVDVNYTIFSTDISSGIFKTFNETHPIRHFSLPELDLLAEAHGFSRINAEEFLTGSKPSDSTWGVCITLEKLND
jgi:SAM-dependent methyltransferase